MAAAKRGIAQLAQGSQKLALRLLGLGALVYALVPPLKPPYLAAAGGLLGLEPVARATSGDDSADA